MCVCGGGGLWVSVFVGVVKGVGGGDAVCYFEDLGGGGVLTKRQFGKGKQMVCICDRVS